MLSDIPVVEVSSREFVVDDEGDKMPVRKRYEYVPYSKVYATKAHREVILQLKPSVTKVFLWCVFKITHGSDILVVNKVKVAKMLDMSYPTVVKGFAELERYGILAQKSTKEYWINPDFFFKGNRIAKYPNNVFVKYSQD